MIPVFQEYVGSDAIFSANEETAQKVISSSTDGNGRSGFYWIRFANGDLMLGVYPQGETYEIIEGEVESDYDQAAVASSLANLKSQLENGK